MNSKIIIAAAADFAAACNKHIAAAEQAVEISDVALTPDGKISALLTSRKSYTSPSAPGSLHEITVLQGAVAEVEAQLAELSATQPHITPVKLLVTGSPAPAGAEEKPKGKSKAGVVLVLGAFQP